ncbi:MAG: hypothetical protein JSS27_11320 [Planctomycetes bacterium]|nr:hypothetical protein [Planctomycetota bacterium]
MAFRTRFWLFLCLALVAAASSALAQETPDGPLPDAAPPKEGHIYNLDSRPFRFRLARKTGRLWTDEIVVAPGQEYVIAPGKTGDLAALEGITGDGKGHITIDYPELGGRIRLMLPAMDRNRNVYVTSWYHVKDSNGFSRLVQAASKAEAEEKHQSLLAEPPLTPTELQRVKQMLRANYVLHDK